MSSDSHTRAGRRQVLASLAGLALGSTMRPAFAEWKPTRPVTLVVPFAPGGSMDVVGRTLATQMSEELGAPVIVDNRPGAGTTVAADYVARAKPDGLTLLITGPVTHLSASLINKPVNYDFIKSFAAVGTATKASFLIVTRGGGDIRGFPELLARARTKPSAVAYASSGSGASPHLVAELLAKRAGVVLLHVPYRGIAPAALAVMAGEVDFSVVDMTLLPQVRAGKLTAVAISSATRSALVPDVPTVAESGLPGFDEPSTIGLLAPAGTPPATLAALNAALNKALAKADVKSKLASLGLETHAGTPDDFTGLMQAALSQYGPLIRSLDLKPG